jgi:hypothetical protein
VLRLFCAVIYAALLFWAGLAVGRGWDQRPAGQPTLSLGPITWRAPDSLLAQRDAARASLLQCHENVAGLEQAAARQNAAVSALGREGQARAKAADRAAEAAHQDRAAAERRVTEILAAKAQGSLSGPDRCLAADRLILESVR